MSAKYISSILAAALIAALIIAYDKQSLELYKVLISLAASFSLVLLVLTVRMPIAIFVVALISMLLVYYGVKSGSVSLLYGGVVGGAIALLLYLFWIRPHKSFSAKKYRETLNNTRD